MVAQNGKTIMITDGGGGQTPFDSDELQTSIIRACIAAGETDSWIAGDLALSVEFALTTAERKFVSREELLDMVARALEESGYPAAAAEYKRMAGTAAVPNTVPLTESAVRESLELTVSLPEDRMSALVRQVLSALKLIGFSRVSPRLVQEMGRQFRDVEQIPLKALPKVPAHKFKSGEGILLRQSEILEQCSPQLLDLLNSGVLRLRNVSRLFSAIKVQLFLEPFAGKSGLTTPVTELSFWASAGCLTSCLDELYDLAIRLCHEKGAVPDEFPCYLSVSDATNFALSYMTCPKSAAKECVHGLMSAVTGPMTHYLFKLTLV